MSVGCGGAGGDNGHGAGAAVHGHITGRGLANPALLERAIARVVVDVWGRLWGFAALGFRRRDGDR